MKNAKASQKAPVARIRSRTFEKSVQLNSQAQYLQDGKNMTLVRWRISLDGVDGRWRLAQPGGVNGGWPSQVAAPAEATS